MKNVVMGTAGHVDHGKTTLVKRLTGVDTDRLEEEKRRGMTIELGFAPLTLPSGHEISIIDVPGHEKFVKTMVAGVTGIDFVMLVVAADEGVMPQTREHIDILSLLNVKAGVVALTKMDLVDSEWLELVKDEIVRALDGTTLEGSPVIPVSAVSGTGIDILVESLEQLSAKASKAAGRELFRLPVDRIFTMTGHGTVITGTVAGGKVSKGEVIEILPSGLTARIRGIQVHNRNIDHAGAGDRCALNLSGIEKADMEKGDVATVPGMIKPTHMVDAILYTVKGNGSISHNQRVHVHIGTKEVLARVRVLRMDEIPGDSKGYVQLRFEEPVAAIRGDRFIIRSYSPVNTIGGGWIIFHSARNRPRFSEDGVQALTVGERGSLKDLVNFVMKSAGTLLSIEDLWQELFENREEIRRAVNEELDTGNILWLKDVNKYLSNDLYSNLFIKMKVEFERFYKKYPYRYQIDREEMKSKIFKEIDSKDFNALLNRFVKDKLFELDGNFIVQPNKVAMHRISAMKETELIKDAIFKDGLNIRNTLQLKQDLNIEISKIEEIERFLLSKGEIIDLGNGTLIHSDVLKRTVEKIRDIIDKHGSASVAQTRDFLETGRKMAVAILEYLDEIQVTQRADDIRKPGVHYLDYFK